MKRILLSLVLGCLPLAALADGMVIPTVAYPATVTIPDQRALICFSNGLERLVIETRFTGAGTNFAWVVPLPSPPVIEEATTGLFPTLQYLFRPEIVHDVPRYYTGILALIGIGYFALFIRPTGKLKWPDVLACIFVGVAAATCSHREVFNAGAFFLVAAILFCAVIIIRITQRPPLAVFGIMLLGSFCLTSLLLPALGTAGMKGMATATSAEIVSILDRKILNDFETTTISSRDANALEAWLSKNGFFTPTNARPAIAGYVKDGWIFVATKVRRASAAPETSTPHPLSFTFKTDKPVYPIQLTGLNGQPLTIDLYVFGNASAAAPHFRFDSCLRPNVVHPLLRQWTIGLPVATKLAATLSPPHMRKDVWLDQTPMVAERRNRLFSRQGALFTTLNWTLGIFVISLVMICGLVFVGKKDKPRLPQLIGAMTVATLAFGGLTYVSLPKIDVKLVKGGRYLNYEMKAQQLMVRIALGDFEWHTTADARAGLRGILSTNAAEYGVKNLENHFVGGQIREEDSPGNYLLRETNNQLQLIFFDSDGQEEIADTEDLSPPH